MSTDGMPRHILVVDDVLHVAKAMLRGGSAHLIERRIYDAGLLLGGYVAAGILTYDLAFREIEYELPLILITPCFQRACTILEQGLQAGQALALPLDALNAEVRAWCAGESDTPEPRRASPSPSDAVDSWLGPRATWCGVSVEVRRIER